MDITPTAPAPAGIKVEVEEFQPSLVATASWTLYDFANTIFSLNIVTTYFPLFITNLGLGALVYTVPQSVSQLIIALICPLIGGLSDKGGGRRMPWLIGTTLFCIGMTIVMGLPPGSFVWLIIGAYVLANVFYQISLIFYDALLPSVSTTETWGTISGWGVGIGYAGALLGGILVGKIIPIPSGAEQSAFIPSALLFLLFALPCFIFVRERKVRLTSQGQIEAEESPASAPLGENASGYGIIDLTKPDTANAPGARAYPQSGVINDVENPNLANPDLAGEPNDFRLNWSSFVRSLTQTWRTLQETRKYPGLFIFLVANFFYSDALNTIIIAMAVYAVKVIGLANAIDALGPAIIAAVIGSILFGFINDRVGSKSSLNISLIMWMIVLIAAIFITDKAIFQYGIATLAGVALGSTWVAARTMMIELSPPEHLGEFMGIYNLTGKFAAVIGPLLWGFSLTIFDPNVVGRVGYQVAIGSLLLMIVLGFVLHQRTPDVRRTSAGVVQG